MFSCIYLAYRCCFFNQDPPVRGLRWIEPQQRCDSGCPFTTPECVGPVDIKGAIRTYTGWNLPTTPRGIAWN